jgi:hypothetical protein
MRNVPMPMTNAEWGFKAAGQMNQMPRVRMTVKTVAVFLLMMISASR